MKAISLSMVLFNKSVYRIDHGTVSKSGSILREILETLRGCGLSLTNFTRAVDEKNQNYITGEGSDSED